MPDPVRPKRPIDRKTRMKLPPVAQVARPPEERIRDFKPTYLPLTPEMAQKAAERCLHCADPAPCVRACPAGNDIPTAMWMIEFGDFAGAAEIYRKTSSLPEICGRVCPHESLCMGSCTLSKRGDAVITGALEAFVCDYQREHGEVTIQTAPPTGRQVAIIGAGPAGLSAAEQLIQKGHAVTIFEAMPVAGGLLTYGIPNFKLSKDVVNSRIEDITRAGARLVTGTTIGKEKTIDNLFEAGFHAVYISVGTGVDAKMTVPGSVLDGIYFAGSFLARANARQAGIPVNGGELKIGERVIVVGGGDTASDCLRTSLRLGASEVTCLYRRTEAEMPGGEKDRRRAIEEGAKYRYLTQPIRFIGGADNQVTAVECLQCELGEPDESGRRRPIPIEGSNFTIEADTVVLALGYWPDPLLGETTPDLDTSKWGLIMAHPETGETSRQGVFAGGDAVSGPDLVVTAMRDGRQAAAAIHAYLKALR
ncbi:MAG: NAD(P)-dependent oxidoreductase [Anaerolineales bacterium]|nr:NAD(P)-dependent oxidoreductase [Anaerolineales bacterium]